MSFLQDIQDASSVGDSCFNYNNCTVKYQACAKDSLHSDVRYAESSAAWVLIASILVFFMKAGFMLLEVAFARSPKERRYVIVLKHQDAFASAFGFFLLGYDVISQYLSVNSPGFFRLTDPVLWFFKFTFASNAATIIGGCLVTNRYKLRMPAAFISAFVISGIIHPMVARLIWSDHCNSLSPYRFCNYGKSPLQATHTCSWNCNETAVSFGDRMYVLDFAGGGAVHLIGGMAGLVVCLFAKFQEWRDRNRLFSENRGAEEQEEMEPNGFWDWMYPVHGGEETVSEAALGVMILWFCWFAFNCGSAESIETGFKLVPNYFNKANAFYGIAGVIACNMILAGAAGGTTAIVIAVWAQVRYRTESVNANEIANGVLSSLVSITAGCAFVDYWAAVIIGLFGVLFYHLGCYLEYKCGIKDTARVVPVHAVCGLWSVIATGLFMWDDIAQCNLHASFEGLCYCHLRLPHLKYLERQLAQLLGALLMIAIGLVGSFIMYFILYIIPIKPFVWLCNRVLFLTPKKAEGEYPPLIYRGGWLLTTPEENFDYIKVLDRDTTVGEMNSVRGDEPHAGGMAIQHGYHKQPSHFGTKPSTYGSLNTASEAGTGNGTGGAKVGNGYHSIDFLQLGEDSDL